ncbi:MAG: hypothetical protein JO126_02425 [Alphaproteobacteria bacterium]|nr:hypothetical protein [Alphaproteobacteria bacterium]
MIEIAVGVLVIIGLWLLFIAQHISGWLEAIAMNTKHMCGILDNLSSSNAKEAREVKSLLESMDEHLRWVALVPKRNEKERIESLGGMPDPVYDKWFYEKKGLSEKP